MKRARLTVGLGMLILAGSLMGAEFKAGVARAIITPPLPFWLSGYASRTNPASGKLHDLWAKALALEDRRGGRVVIVTTDLIGLPRQVSDEVAAQAAKKHGLARSQLVLNSSHTHSGPAVGSNLSVMFDFNDEEKRRRDEYANNLTSTLIRVVGDALSDMAPARLSTGHGMADFAMNRREPTVQGVRIGLNRTGPVDHDVPVLTVTTMEGGLRAVLFGYACHNTTLGGDRYQVNGDYAGFAQLDVESRHPGATALFFILCGADQNPQPRGKPELAMQHGKSLADAVERSLEGELRPVRAPIRTAYTTTNLEFAPHKRQTFETELAGNDRFRQRRAKLMLAAYDRGEPITHVAYPVQAVRLGREWTLLALGGEVVVDYSLRAKKEYPAENMVVAGYSNEVMCYIPSLRVLIEGGYEPVDSMIYYGCPGPFADSVEERVFSAVHQVMKRVGVKLPPADR